MTTITLPRATVEQALEALIKGCNINATEWHQAIYALRAALAQQKDPTDPGNDVNVLREHVRHLERRIRELHAQQAEPVPAWKPAEWKRGCAVCGIGADGKAYGYVCPRLNCPTKVTFGGAV